MKKRENRKWLYLKPVLFVLAIAAAAGLIIYFAPQLKRFLTDSSTAVKLEEWIASFGIFGIPVLFGLQVLQVFIAIIPSEPFEIAAGMCYGWFYGFLICYGGVVLGSFLVFRLIKRFGQPFVDKLGNGKKLKEFNFLKNVKRLEGITFVLYFIPGLPKDIFTYFAALTEMKTKNFLIVSSIARVPSIIVSTIAGSQFMQGNYRATVIIFAVFAALGILGMVIYRVISSRLNKKCKEGGESENGCGGF